MDNFKEFVHAAIELSKNQEMEYVVDDFLDKRYIAFGQQQCEDLKKLVGRLLKQKPSFVSFEGK